MNHRTTTDEPWRVWDADTDYGDVLYRRAVGELPEMESSKKMAAEVARVHRPGDSILDVGCGAGHYLRSLRRVLGGSFAYTGVDATEPYLLLARKAFEGDSNCCFRQSDVYALDLPDASFDIVMCNNVLLHLPSIARPLCELFRVARHTLLVRLLCGERSFRIQDVRPQADGREFADDGTPIDFHYYNIYSRAYVASIVSRLPGVQTWTIRPDLDFDADNIRRSTADHPNAHDATTVVGGYQTNGYVLQPWAVVEVTRRAART